MTDDIGLIVGSGAQWLGLEVEARSATKTPYGEPSSPLMRSRLGGRRVLWIARHGEAGGILPHEVNYRANVWALHEHGIRRCIAVNAVGIIVEPGFSPGNLAIPDQLIDYTWGRAHSFDDRPPGLARHIDFTQPFDPILRERLLAAATATGPALDGGVCGVTQGPRLETAAEIVRMARDGCTMVGMTAMPEAALAREIGLHYAICAVGVNLAAGLARDGSGLHAQLERYFAAGMARVREALERVLPEL